MRDLATKEDLKTAMRWMTVAVGLEIIAAFGILLLMLPHVLKG
ncbi:hypothetical protein [Agrobacterium rosae]|nr:hypothetical protein [Agrobacterium rosae]